MPSALGDKGEAVKALQADLATLGYLQGSGAVDGIFGPKTQGALVAFQTAVGLFPPSGVADEATLGALRKAADAGAVPKKETITFAEEEGGEVVSKRPAPVPGPPPRTAPPPPRTAPQSTWPLWAGAIGFGVLLSLGVYVSLSIPRLRRG